MFGTQDLGLFERNAGWQAPRTDAVRKPRAAGGLAFHVVGEERVF